MGASRLLPQDAYNGARNNTLNHQTNCLISVILFNYFVIYNTNKNTIKLPLLFILFNFCSDNFVCNKRIGFY